MGRSAITPGRLYRLLSEQLRAMRAHGCTSCRMPMPYLTAPADDGANWAVRTPRACQPCTDLVAVIVGRASMQYDLFDPTAQPG